MLALSLLTRSRYRPSDECLRLAELAVSESEGSPNLSESAHIRFVLGLVHLWRGNFEDAIEQMKVAFALTQRIGDVVVRTRCLIYLAVAYRRSGNVEKARSTAERAKLSVATSEAIEEWQNGAKKAANSKLEAAL